MIIQKGHRPFRYTAFLFLVMMGISPAPSANAGFILEGLKPFSVSPCGARDSYADPFVSPPAGAMVGSPSAYNDGGIPRFHAQDCSDVTSIKGKTPPSKPKVPQK